VKNLFFRRLILIPILFSPFAAEAAPLFFLHAARLEAAPFQKISTLRWLLTPDL